VAGPSSPCARIVIVDDSAEFRLLLRASLRDRRCDVVGEAADGAEAVALLGTVDCDRVVMDCRMPVMNGLAATAEILRHRPGLEIVAFTDSGDSAAAFFAAGAQAYFPKSDFPGLLAHLCRPLEGGPTPE
jgi:DNA-binding NarL/FixJ family response regulator